jgi:hypothetical protein
LAPAIKFSLRLDGDDEASDDAPVGEEDGEPGVLVPLGELGLLILGIFGILIVNWAETFVNEHTKIKMMRKYNERRYICGSPLNPK